MSGAAGAPGAASARDDAGRLRGRPRSSAVDAAIIETVLRLIEDGATMDGLSIERIARGAGVGKATVYRRWPGREALMIDVVRSLEEPGPRPSGGPVRDDLVAVLEFLRRRGLAERNSALLRIVLAHKRAHQELWREYQQTVVAGGRALMVAVLRRGIASGEIRADVDPDLLADLFTGPLLARSLVHERSELPEGLAERIADTVLAGVRPVPDAPPPTVRCQCVTGRGDAPGPGYRRPPRRRCVPVVSQ